MPGLVENVILNCVRARFPSSSVGKPSSDAATLLTYMQLILKSGMAWRHLANTGCPYNFRTVHRAFQNWNRADVFEDVYRVLFRLYRRKRRPKYHCIDSTYVKKLYGTDCIGRNPTDRGRRASKLSAVVDDTGIPVALKLFPGNHSDFKTVSATMMQGIEFERGLPIYADKGYDSSEVRHQLQCMGYVDRVSRRRYRGHRILNRKRAVVEHFFCWLDKSRRLLMRFDAKSKNYMGWTWLASCRIIESRIKK